MKVKKFFISSSILSADFSRLGDDVNKVISAGVDMIHFDVMDNHYVNNFTVGSMVLRSLRSYGILSPIEVHLMAFPIDRLIYDFISSGADCIIFHPESSNHIVESLQIIKQCGCRSGLAFNLTTSFDCLTYIMDQIDVILIMSVNPGYGGQSFIPSALDKIKEAYSLIKESGLNIDLEVDGGVKVNNITSIANAGANIFVIGSAIFDSSNYLSVVNSIRDELSKVI